MSDSGSDRRHPLQAFDAAVLEGVLGNRRIVSVTLFRAGRSNSNYRLALDNGREVVLRLHADGSGSRERTVLALVAGTVPVPRLLEWGAGWSLLTLMPGEPLSRHPEWTSEAARVMARIWSHRFETRGWIEADGSVSPFEFGGAADFYEAMLRHPSVREFLGRNMIARLREVLSGEVEGSDREDASGCLVHGDFNPTNILMHDGHVSGILDWEFAHSGEPFMDIANLVRHTPATCLEALRRGIDAAGFSLPDDWRRRCDRHRLGSYLEFLTTERTPSFKQQCVEWIRAYVEKTMTTRTATQ